MVVKIHIVILWLMILHCSLVMDTSLSGKCQLKVMLKKGVMQYGNGQSDPGCCLIICDCFLSYHLYVTCCLAGLEDLVLSGWIKWILKKQGEGDGLIYHCPGWRQMESSCEQGNEPFGFIRGGE
jgi:hypothetical protein